MNSHEKSPKVLIVDDEYANLFFMKKVLTSEGFDTYTATNALEAELIIHEKKPDAILLDIMMPEISGLDLLKKLQNDEKTKCIPVIMVTAKTDSIDVETALNLGAIEYIKKPVDDIELLARLKTVLKIKYYEDNLKENLKAKEEFINIVAHDLRTPFATIAGFAELLKQDENLKKILSEEHKQIFEYIGSTSQFLIEYFNKLLAWAKLGSESLNLERSLETPFQIIENILTIYQPKIKEKNLKIKTIDIDRYRIYIDEVYFGQAVGNIINNSIKFTPHDGEIIIKLERDNNMFTKLTVQDTGIGMDDDLIQKILSDFPVKPQRGTNGEKGYGLGLKISKKILDSHKFKLNIYSKPEEGTIVEIIIPPKDLCI